MVHINKEAEISTANSALLKNCCSMRNKIHILIYKNLDLLITMSSLW